MLTLVAHCLLLFTSAEQTYQWESHDLMLNLSMKEMAGSKVNAVRLKLLLNADQHGQGTLELDPNTSLFSEVGNPRETTTAPVQNIEVTIDSSRELQDWVHASEPNRKVTWMVAPLKSNMLKLPLSLAWVKDEPNMARLLIHPRNEMVQVIPLRLVPHPPAGKQAAVDDLRSLHLTMARVVKRDDVERTLTITTLSRTPFVARGVRTGNVVRTVMEVSRQPCEETLSRGHYYIINRHGVEQPLDRVWPRLQPGTLLFRLDGPGPLSTDVAAVLGPDALILLHR